ncbi:MAG: division/cell wall cluster transcriptional repressor MraZ [Candidatus Muirbacterium halophilum]|nr:division/cell wall cluster transcriptional repressor MraZ [Candidatus Muirbacterium halophilum]MCK9475419.1 division/cell wall cluster transcriptional repressor MraZ [Candidatus Muirbacterium halophilum]
MYLGEYQHNIDNKGRIIIPSRFRDELGEKFIITCGFEKCLVVYSMDEWNKYSAKISSLPSTRADARAFLRLIYSKAIESSCDKLGRIVLPQNLREYANIDKEAVVNGNFNTIEIWNKQAWNEYSNSAFENFEKQAEKLSDLLI